VRRLGALAEHLDRPGLWLKNDGLLGAAYGGNKLRKLEFVLADVLRRGASTIVTFGGTGSHHCLATAIYGRELGLRVAAVLLEQPETDEVRANVRRMASAGARTTRAGNLLSAAARAPWLALRCTEFGFPPRLPYLLWVGSSTPLGCVGYVNAALEMAEQIREGLLPQPRAVLLPLGSCGTAAGLLLGLRLAGLDTAVIAVQVSDMPTVGARTVARLANATARLLRRRGASLPRLSFHPRDITVISTREGRRYGHPMREAEEAKGLVSRLEGLALDSTYTAKTVAALIGRSDLPRPLLYWHTLNAHPLPSSD
jgi:D-cysteine desulfhydrase